MVAFSTASCAANTSWFNWYPSSAVAPYTWRSNSLADKSSLAVLALASKSVLSCDAVLIVLSNSATCWTKVSLSVLDILAWPNLSNACALVDSASLIVLSYWAILASAVVANLAEAMPVYAPLIPLPITPPNT